MADEAGEGLEIPLTVRRTREVQLRARPSRQKSRYAGLLRLKEVVGFAQANPKRLFGLTRIAQLSAQAIEKLEP